MSWVIFGAFIIVITLIGLMISDLLFEIYTKKINVSEKTDEFLIGVLEHANRNT